MRGGERKMQIAEFEGWAACACRSRFNACNAVYAAWAIVMIYGGRRSRVSTFTTRRTRGDLNKVGREEEVEQFIC